MDNTLFQYGRHDLSNEVASPPPFIKPQGYTPLCQQPVPEGCSMPANNPVDQLVLESCTKKSSTTEESDQPSKEDKKEELELSKCVPQTEEMITHGIKQLKQSTLVNKELKLLLEYELKILQQVMTRIDKFKALRDENKRKATEWEDSYKQEIPEYEESMNKLVNVPHSQVLNVEGFPAPVQQKILFQIVSRTTNNANRVLVQLSMEETVANDIELTLSDLKKHITVMIRQINYWKKIITEQINLQQTLVERWTDAKNKLNAIKDKCNDTASINGVNMKPYDDRLKKIEYAICCMLGPAYGVCKNNPPEPPCPCPDPHKKIDQDCPPDPNECAPPSYGPIKQNPNTCFDPQDPNCPSNQDPYGQSWMSSQSPQNCDPTRGPGSPGTPECRGVSPQQQSPQNFARCPPVGQPPNISPQHPSPGENCSPPTCPQYSPVSPPFSPATSPQFSDASSPFPVWEETPELRRGRAPPGAFPDIELVDTPGMGYPIPRAALERGGRPIGQTVPLSPPSSPPPRDMGRFRPFAASSPPMGQPGVLRPREQISVPPPHPMAGQPLDPALLPKIQEDLRKLGERNRHLQDLVNNFRRIRANLTDEIDKAVRLNQKLQRDLQYVVKAHGQ